MNKLFRTMGTTRQAFHQRKQREMKRTEEYHQLLPLIRQLREDHPRMSSRVMYRLLQPRHLGRDRFEAFCFNQGLKLDRRRSFHRTTNSWGVTRFPNLVEGRELTAINQAWVSDITYLAIADQVCFLTFITDLYSRRIVGHSISQSLRTQDTTLPALRQALRRKPAPGLIIHSDGGGQYYCKEFLAVTAIYQIRNSMCETVEGNAHAERLNGIIKNDYVIPYAPGTLSQLKAAVNKAVHQYNLHRPHQALDGLSPSQFEASITDQKHPS